jgi:5-methylcytosine-specific restriction endonuclease McrA
MASIDDMLRNWGVIQPHEKRRFATEVRAKLAWLSQQKCANCHNRIALGPKDVYMQMNAGHVVAWSKNGPNSWDNLVCLCWTCNQKQNDRSFLEAFGVVAAFRLNAQALVNGILGPLL